MGYPDEIFFEKTPQELRCVICLLTLESPHSCKEGHLFCLECIKKWLYEKEICPCCKSILIKDFLNKSLLANSMLNKLKIICRNNHYDFNIEGLFKKLIEADRQSNNQKQDVLKCKWEGTLEQMEQHNKTCQLRPLSCTNNHIFPFYLEKQHCKTCISPPVLFVKNKQINSDRFLVKENEDDWRESFDGFCTFPYIHFLLQFNCSGNYM